MPTDPDKTVKNMNNKRLLARLRQFVRQYPIAVLSASVLSFGGLPLLVYSNSVDQLPDFTLSELTGTLIATFATEAALAALIGLYCLLAGIAARYTLNYFYPDDPAAAPGADHSHIAIQREKLVKGAFIVVATVLTMAIWIDILSIPTHASPFAHWHDATMEAFVACAYFAWYAAIAALLLFDWRAPGTIRPRVRAFLWAVFATATLFGVAAYFAARLNPTLVDSSESSSAHPIAHAWRMARDVYVSGLQSVGARVNACPTCKDTWIYGARQVASTVSWSIAYQYWLGAVVSGGLALVALIKWWNASLSRRGAIRLGAIATVPWAAIGVRWCDERAGPWSAWFTTAHLPWTMLIGSVLVVGVLWGVMKVLARVGRKWRASAATGAGNWAAWKLVLAKAAVTVAFGLCTAFVILFVFAIVGGVRPSVQSQTLMLASSVLVVLNWIAFALPRGRKQFIVLWGLSSCVMLIFVPLMGESPSLFPRLLVTSLGFGNRHVASISLSGQQCATLAPYGVHCEKGKDDAITLTDVNIVNRLGSSVQLELLLRTGSAVTAEPANAAARARNHVNPVSTRAGRPKPVSKSVAPYSVQTLVLAVNPIGIAGAGPQRQLIYQCDQLLLEKLAAAVATANAGMGPGKVARNPANPPHVSVDPQKSLVCARVTVPKDQVLGYTSAGVRTYEAGFSGYIVIPEKPKK